MSIDEQLRNDPRLPDNQWRWRQQELVEQAQGRCERCGNTDRSIHAYRIPDIPGLQEITTPEYHHCLCEPCYRDVHDLYENLQWTVYELGIGSKLEQALRVIQRLVEGVPCPPAR